MLALNLMLGTGLAPRGRIAADPLVLFAIMFRWQLPPTFALAGTFRAANARAGIHLLPRDSARGGNPSNPVVIGASLALIVVGMMPTLLGFAGIPYLVIGTALSAGMFAFGYRMFTRPDDLKAARSLLLTSL